MNVVGQKNVIIIIELYKKKRKSKSLNNECWTISSHLIIYSICLVCISRTAYYLCLFFLMNLPLIVTKFFLLLWRFNIISHNFFFLLNYALLKKLLTLFCRSAGSNTWRTKCCWQWKKSCQFNLVKASRFAFCASARIPCRFLDGGKGWGRCLEGIRGDSRQQLWCLQP